MSESVRDLLSSESVDDVDALMAWARRRVAELVEPLEGDAELGPLLGEGGVTGPASRVDGPEPLESRATEPSNAAPLPPIPSAPSDGEEEELDVDEIEELDVEELELLDEDEEPAADADEGSVDEVAEPAGDDEVTGRVEVDRDATAFGPPDGNEHVPEWKAALMSTQTETDEEAAQRVKEASTAGPLPQEPADEVHSTRLEAEDDEISQHSVDLSDLDTDDD